jgi:hypothetical protein
MKETLRKTEGRKIALFTLFTAGVIFMLYLEARAETHNATAAVTVETVDHRSGPLPPH